MEDVETVMFRAVEVIRDAGTAFLCLIGKQQVWVPLNEIRDGTELAEIGHRGRLVISRWFAEEIGLHRAGPASG